MNGTHHDVLLYHIWIFAHRLNKENLNLRGGKGESSLDTDNKVTGCCAAPRYLEAILLCKLDDGFSPFPGGVCCIKNRNLSFFFCKVLSNVVQCSRSTLSVTKKGKEILRKCLNVGICSSASVSRYLLIFSPSSLSGLKNSKDL